MGVDFFGDFGCESDRTCFYCKPTDQISVSADDQPQKSLFVRFPDSGTYIGGDLAVERNLRENNVAVLEDEVVPIAGNVVLCGRQDAGQRNRMTMAELAENFGPDTFSVILDHQPNDYAAQAEAGADLVISGHTHGGQFIPINRVGELIGANDMTYGTATKGHTRFLITSGISDWAFQFKTGCISEYFVIDLLENKTD